MRCAEELLLAVLAEIHPIEAAIPLYSTVTGTLIDGSALNAAYWWQNVRQPVRFGTAMNALITGQYQTFVEVGPHPVLQNSITEALRTAGVAGNALASLHRERPERATMLQALGSLFTLGFNPKWRALTRPDARYVKLPSYPWQREHHWHESSLSKEDRLGQPGSAFLSTPLHSPIPAWEVELNTGFFPYLNDHCLDKTVLFPGTGDMSKPVLIMHQTLWPQEMYTLEHLVFQKALVIDPKDVTIMHLRCRPAEPCIYHLQSTQRATVLPWEMHATGRVLTGTARPKRSVSLTNLA